MKSNTGRIRISNAGTYIADMLCCQIFLQLLIKKAANTTASNILTDINGGFHRPVVSSTSFEGGSVSITYGNTAFLGHQIRVTGEGMPDAFGEFLHGRNRVFKSDRGVLHIGSVNGSQGFGILRRLFVGMGLGAGSFIILLLIFGSPSEKELRIENTRLLAQYNVLSHRLDEAMGVMQDIQQRDDNLYRVVLQADPVSDAVRKAGYGGTNRYEQLRDMANADLVINTTQKLDMLNRQLYIQSKSFDEVVDLCKSHDEMLKCIPAIQPVSNKDLKKTASGYGVRIDPIYKTTKFHAGMDFSASPGTPVYATGDGVVVKAGWETGYGNTIEVNHGFGYLTRYAHLSAYKVRPGQKVVRGEVIGAVGSTGKSTGPHLHYEVHVKGKVQNPVNYYFMDLSAEDYDKMIQIAANHGKVFD